MTGGPVAAAAARNRRGVLRAVAWMSGALFCFMTMGLSGSELSVELAPFGITVNNVLPGLTRTTRLDSSFGPTRCRMICYCNACRNTFEHLKRV